MQEIIESRQVDYYQQRERRKTLYGFLKNYNSVNTRSAYARDLQLYWLFLDKNFKISDLEVDHDHMVAYKQHLIDSVLSKRTINRKLATLSAYYDHLIKRGIMNTNPTSFVRRYKLETEVTTNDFKDDQVIELLNSIDTGRGAGLLHRALLSFYFSTGMRHNEVRTLKFENLTIQNNLIIVHYEAKGQKERRIPLGDRLVQFLSQYWSWCKNEGYTFSDRDYIFRPTQNRSTQTLNKPLNPKSINRIIQLYAKKIGIQGHFSIHSARATAIGRLLDSGLGIEKVANFVGHKSIMTTKNYYKRTTSLEKSPVFDLEECFLLATKD